ncbi:MAG: nickel pincer cofactor biosynthesis protein LarC [Methanomethylovorans sp.]|uniref:nickel pincer cofactor biosynthesis protein LarC n=1 Tax=Methanomethylovorans sp. TaxID=2758717 RepID=UPI003C78E48C
MRTMVFDAFSGASGDMILGTLISLGADGERIRQIIESAVDVSVRIEKVKKGGIHAVDVHIDVEHEEHARRYEDLVDIVQNAGLSTKVEHSALAVFGIMAKAESEVHGESLKDLHFHEVGQNDALADVIGSCFAMHEIGADAIYCLPINAGGGRVKAAHGSMPVPAPATLEILRSSGLSFYGSGNRELLTPTGAAILSHFARPIENYPSGKVLSIGYGAGDADTDSPNVLRSILIDTDDDISKESIEVLETNVDDVTGEVLGNLFEKLLSMGAKDVAIVPATMKKGRTGHIIKVITRSEHSAVIAREIMRETGTLGVRVIPTKHRYTADRRINSVRVIMWGKTYDMPVKISEDRNGEILHISAEYEDCKRVAKELNIPLKDVIRKVEEQAWNVHGPHDRF